MNRRPFRESGLLVSEVGLGCEHLQEMEYGQIKAVADEARMRELAIFSTYLCRNPRCARGFGKSPEGQKNEVLLQGHIGAALAERPVLPHPGFGTVPKLFFRIFSPGLKRIPSIWGCPFCGYGVRTTLVCSTAL